jgi:hypothetical protein
MYLPLILAAIVLFSAIYLLLQYASRTLVIDSDEVPRAIDELPARDTARAA